MRRSLVLVAGSVALALIAGAAGAITVTPGAWADADATIGENIIDANDILVKPCDCEPVEDPGFFQVYTPTGALTPVHYEIVEGKIITTTDAVPIGTILSVQNNGARQILLIVQVEGGVLGAIDRINVRRNAFYWTGTAVVINTTLADLRASIAAIGLTM